MIDISKILNDTVVSLPQCTRIEVIDDNGRVFHIHNWKPTNTVQLSVQDDGRTLKIFIISNKSI